jgi:hypothetical protein
VFGSGGRALLNGLRKNGFAIVHVHPLFSLCKCPLALLFFGYETLTGTLADIQTRSWISISES